MIGSESRIPESIRRRTWIEVDLSTETGDPPIDIANFMEGHPAIQTMLQSVQEAASQFASQVTFASLESEEDEFYRKHEPDIGQLPLSKQDIARQALMRVVHKFFDSPIELRMKVAEVVLQAFSRDEYAAILEEVYDADPMDVMGVAKLLEKWGLYEVRGLLERAQRRQQVLDTFDQLVADPATLELEGVHKSLKDNLWLLGDSYELLTSNQTLRRAVQVLGGVKYDGDRGRERPDLILGDQPDRMVLVELKRPSERVDHKNIGQALTYQGELRRQFSKQTIDVFIIAGNRDPALDESMYNERHVYVKTFYDVLNSARQRMHWLINHLDDDERITTPSGKDTASNRASPH